MVANHQKSTVTKMSDELNAFAMNKVFKGGIYGLWCLGTANTQATQNLYTGVVEKSKALKSFTKFSHVSNLFMTMVN